MPYRQHRTNKRDSLLQVRARDLRSRLTPAEQILWRELRGRRFAGVKFRRQYTYGPYILDFCCVELRVVVELDGETHVGKTAADDQRQAWLESQGWQVVHFYNHEVYESLEEVLDTLHRILDTRSAGAKNPLTPPPLPQGGEGRERPVAGQCLTPPNA